VADQVGELAVRGGACGDDCEDPAGAQHPLAGRVQQPLRKADPRQSGQTRR
jgi:hypothetical protein